ncbi:MAG: DUF47 domain-containing protein [Christensenellales bacterium]|jgi:predicted phosphate transport protein (TIGR00153 family)
MSKNDKNYFDAFVIGVEYCLKAAQILKEMLYAEEIDHSRIVDIKKIEQEADSHAHGVYRLLNNAFITPIDREDIYYIVHETDDIIDSIDTVANQIWMMDVKCVTPEACQMAEMVLLACENLVKLMSELKNHKKDGNRLKNYTIEINRIEEEGDKIYQNAMHRLFTSDMEPIEIIKMKKIYEVLEDALDDCEDVADGIDRIIVTKT